MWIGELGKGLYNFSPTLVIVCNGNVELATCMSILAFILSDLIAIPDFGAGAMENWGLITYRETALMFDPVHTSSRDQQRVAVVIAHELAHQWFGNLVTMSWLVTAMVLF